MDFKQIQNIIKDFENSNITNLEIEMEQFKLKLNKNQTQETLSVAPKKLIEKEEKVEDTSFKVKSPLVGTFYAANSPEELPFVEVGQKVNKGDTLCIIEAMKIMNEITAPISGVVESIHINNGEPIGYDEVIMSIV